MAAETSVSGIGVSCQDPRGNAVRRCRAGLVRYGVKRYTMWCGECHGFVAWRWGAENLSI